MAARGDASNQGRNVRVAWCSVAATVIAATACTASPMAPEPAPKASAAPIVSSAAASAPPPAPPSVASRPEGEPAVAPVPRGPLANFHEALRALERGERRDHVRILWLGDSHAQADFWTDHVRKGLQRRFGNGGPGFVHLGMRGYRHADVRLDLGGQWRMRPKQPATIEPWGDGAFGLGGVLNAGYAGDRAAILRFEDVSLAGKKVRWDLCYKPGLANDRFRVMIEPPDGIGEAGPVEEIQPREEDVGRIHHLLRETVGPRTLRVKIADGRPDFCGVIIETDPAEQPGVVLDNLGINGARYATALAWSEEAWAREVERRRPELFVFEYGGNEAGDIPSAPPKYKADALRLIARAARIRPEASCLVIGPSDRMDAESKIPPIVAVLAEAAQESGCMFWNTYEVMGGRGSLRAWRDTERASEDGIHLKPKGYAELGALLLADLLADYRQ